MQNKLIPDVPWTDQHHSAKNDVVRIIYNIIKYILFESDVINDNCT